MTCKTTSDQITLFPSLSQIDFWVRAVEKQKPHYVRPDGRNAFLDEKGPCFRSRFMSSQEISSYGHFGFPLWGDTLTYALFIGPKPIYLKQPQM